MPSSDAASLLGAHVVARGVASPDVIDPLLEQGFRRGAKLGRVLLDAGILSEPELQSLLQEQRQRRLLTFCRWSSGEVLFADGERSGEEPVPLQQHPLAIVTHALLAAYGDAEIARLLQGLSRLRMTRSTRDPSVIGNLGLPEREHAVLAGLSGQPALADFIGYVQRHAAVHAAEVRRALFIGLASGAIEPV